MYRLQTEGRSIDTFTTERTQARSILKDAINTVKFGAGSPTYVRITLDGLQDKLAQNPVGDNYQSRLTTIRNALPTRHHKYLLGVAEEAKLEGDSDWENRFTFANEYAHKMGLQTQKPSTQPQYQAPSSIDTVVTNPMSGAFTHLDFHKLLR